MLCKRWQVYCCNNVALNKAFFSDDRKLDVDNAIYVSALWSGKYFRIIPQRVLFY